MPFESTKGLHLVCSIVKGDRPTKPTNAAEIGLSGSLWELLQACWDGDRTRRPRMQYVEAQIGNATIPNGIPATSRRPGALSPKQIAVSTSSSSTATKSSTTSDQSQLNIPIIKIDMVEPEDKSHLMQEFYPPPSPISPIQPGSFSNEAMINRVDEVSPLAAQCNLVLMMGLDSGPRFCRRTGASKSIEPLMQVVLPSPNCPEICQDSGLL